MTQLRIDLAQLENGPGVQGGGGGCASLTCLRCTHTGNQDPGHELRRMCIYFSRLYLQTPAPPLGRRNAPPPPAPLHLLSQPLLDVEETCEANVDDGFIVMT